MQNKFSYNLFRILIFFYVMWGGHAWFTFFLEKKYVITLIMYSVGVIIAILYQISNNIQIKRKGNYLLAYIALFLFYIFSNRLTGVGLITAPIHYFLHYYPLMVLISDTNHAEDYITFIVKVLVWILIPSMVLYSIMLFLPVIPSVKIDWEEASPTYIFFNYLVLIRNIYFSDSFRFTAIFLEPSYLAITSLFLLYLRQYNFHNRENTVLLMAIILSTSLAGYLVGLIGFILIGMINKRMVRGLLLVLLVGFVVFQFGMNYNGGNNMVSEFIIQRLVFDEEKGIVGNNRTVMEVDLLYENMVNDGSIWRGIGNEELARLATTHGAGYKMAFIRGGIISSLLLLLFYWFIGISGTNGYKRKYMITFLILYIIMFIPNANASSYNWMIPFMLAASSDKKQRLEYS